MDTTTQPAATIMLLRDGHYGFEVFMVVRHHTVAFAAGALVFPGGRVVEADHELGIWVDCPNPGALGAEARTFRVVAIRETFEACGLPLARRHGSSQLITAEVITG